MLIFEMSHLMTFLFILQIILAILLICIILLQSSDEDALSGIGAGASSTSILSHKSTVDLITRVTIFLIICFLINSLSLAVIAKKKYKKGEMIIQDYINKTNTGSEQKVNPISNTSDKK